MRRHPDGSSPPLLTPGLTPANARSFSSQKGPASGDGKGSRSDWRPDPVRAIQQFLESSSIRLLEQSRKTNKAQPGDKKTERRHAPDHVTCHTWVYH